MNRKGRVFLMYGANEPYPPIDPDPKPDEGGGNSED